MPGKLQQEIQQKRPFASPEAEAFLNIQRTADALQRDSDSLFDRYGITGTQYNVLRILRGAGEGGATCSEIAERMITRDPDITRLLDRMEKRGLIRRSRSARDRRVVTTTLTARGSKLLAELDEPVAAMHTRQLKPLSRQQLLGLIEALEKIRQGG